MKKLLFSFLVIITFSPALSQVAGVSAEKLAVINPPTVKIRTVEFEPLVSYLWSTKTFNNNGDLVPLNDTGDSTMVLHGIGMRVTYGFAKNFEIGGVVTTDLTTLSLGMKAVLFEHENFSGAALLGTTLSNESDFVIRNSGFFGKTASVAGGFAFSNQLGKGFSVDYHIQYQNLFDGSQSYTDDYFLNADFGYAFKKPHILVAGLAYKYNHYKTGQDDAYLLTLHTGVAVMTGKMFILVLDFPFDLIGKNTDRFNGFNFALTVTFD